MLKSIEAKLLYTWTIPHLDKDGLMDADPELLKATVVPLVNEITTKNIEKFIQEIEGAGLWEIFEAPSGLYLRDPVFFDRQTVNPNEKKSQILSIINGLTPRVNQDAIKIQSRCNQDGSPKNRIEENRIEKKRKEEQALCVFSYWKEKARKGKAQYSPKRKEKIIQRLKEGYTVEEAKRAIDGCMASDFHVSGNHVDITLIFRDPEHFERFRDGIKNQKRYGVPEDWGKQ